MIHLDGALHSVPRLGETSLLTCVTVALECISSRPHLLWVGTILARLLGIADSDIELDELCVVAIVLDLIVVLVQYGRNPMEKDPHLDLVDSRSNLQVQCCLMIRNTSQIIPNPYSTIAVSPLPKGNLNRLKSVND